MPTVWNRILAARRNVLLTLVVCVVSVLVLSKVLGLSSHQGGRIAGYIFPPLAILATVVGLVRPGGKRS